MKEELDRLFRGAFLRRLRLRLYALAVHEEGDDQHDEGDGGHDDNAFYHRRVLHVRDHLAVFADHRFSGGVQTVRVGKARDEQHRDGAERGADGAEDRELAALMRVGRHDGGQRAVGDLQHRVGHR